MEEPRNQRGDPPGSGMLDFEFAASARLAESNEWKGGANASGSREID